jgi:hypothetical protein
MSVDRTKSEVDELAIDVKLLGDEIWVIPHPKKWIAFRSTRTDLWYSVLLQ